MIAGLVLAGLAFQPAPAQADARDLLEHVQRQKQEQREQSRQDQDRDARREERQRQWQERRAGREQRDEEHSEREPRQLQDFRRDPSRGIGPGEAARRAQQRNGGGRVLGVNPIDDGYSVRLLKQGEVRTLLIPQGE